MRYKSSNVRIIWKKEINILPPKQNKNLKKLNQFLIIWLKGYQNCKPGSSRKSTVASNEQWEKVVLQLAREYTYLSKCVMICVHYGLFCLETVTIFDAKVSATRSAIAHLFCFASGFSLTRRPKRSLRCLLVEVP